MDTCSWCPRGGTGAATAGIERLLSPGQASGGKWPSGAVDRPVLRDCILCFPFPAVRPECPAGVPRSMRGQPTFPAVRVRVQGSAPVYIPLLAASLSVSGTWAGTDEESAAPPARMWSGLCVAKQSDNRKN